MDLSEIVTEGDAESFMSFHILDSMGIYEYSLARYSPDGGNKWCALAGRKERDLSNYDGFYLKAESDQYLRYYVELRSGDRWYYSSLKLYPDTTNHCFIPFDKFYRVMNGLEAMPLSKIDSLFISASNYTCRTGFQAKMKIHEMGFYKQK